MLPKIFDMVPEVDKTPDLMSIYVLSVVLCEQSGRPSKCKLLVFMKWVWYHYEEKIHIFMLITFQPTKIHNFCTSNSFLTRKSYAVNRTCQTLLKRMINVPQFVLCKIQKDKLAAPNNLQWELIPEHARKSCRHLIQSEEVWLAQGGAFTFLGCSPGCDENSPYFLAPSIATVRSLL